MFRRRCEGGEDGGKEVDGGQDYVRLLLGGIVAREERLHRLTAQQSWQDGLCPRPAV